MQELITYLQILRGLTDSFIEEIYICEEVYIFAGLIIFNVIS